MLNVISHPFVIVLLFMIPAVVCLAYLWGASRAKAPRKRELRRLYIFLSEDDYIENVTSVEEVNQHLRIYLDNGSICAVSTPARYRLLIQD